MIEYYERFVVGHFCWYIDNYRFVTKVSLLSFTTMLLLPLLFHVKGNFLIQMYYLYKSIIVLRGFCLKPQFKMLWFIRSRVHIVQMTSMKLKQHVVFFEVWVSRTVLQGRLSQTSFSKYTSVYLNCRSFYQILEKHLAVPLSRISGTALSLFVQRLFICLEIIIIVYYAKHLMKVTAFVLCYL
jgi:hypothetical protein